MKHLIKKEKNILHGTIGWLHNGKDGQYCEAGDVVKIKWQPAAGWGLQEVHYTDAGGNVVAIEGGEFVMPDSAVTIGATFKRFVVQNWTEGIKPSKSNVFGVGENGEPIPMPYLLEKGKYPFSSFYYRNNRIITEKGIITREGATSNNHIVYFVDEDGDAVVFKKGTRLKLYATRVSNNDANIRFGLYSSLQNIASYPLKPAVGSYGEITAKANETTIIEYECIEDGIFIFGATRLGQSAYWSSFELEYYLEITLQEEVKQIAQLNGTSIVSQNPPLEWSSKFMSAKKRYYTSSETNNPNPIVLAQISDIHGSWDNVQRFIDFTNHYNIYIDDLINTGDTVSAYYTDGMSGFSAIEGAEKILNAIGNHDTRGENGWNEYVGVNAYNMVIKPYVNNWGVTQPTDAAINGYCYYYKDYAAQKLRLVVVDIMGYDLTQDTWLQSVLTDAITNSYSVAIAVHFAGAAAITTDPPFTKINCNYSTLTTLATSSTQLATYNANAYMLPASVDTFMTNGGEFVGYLTGHFHAEVYASVYDYPDQLIFGAESGCGGVERRDYNHVDGTRFQDGFNIVAIDTYLKIVKIYKVGAYIDNYGRIKNAITVNYSTKTIVTDD